MPETDIPISVRLFDDNLLLFTSMIEDIRQAKKYIYLETFRFNDDSIGRKFRDALMEKAKEGLDIRLLLDAYGSKPSEMFAEMEQNGIKIRYFKKIKFFLSNSFARNNTRNHRKLFTTDTESCRTLLRPISNRCGTRCSK